ncbi:hypothetical protein [Roseomonas sp. BN140053]|uniref:hypothetical protein n=1 Tax=Roseomonas sp. BN140053 TaxID=3391898 RepID=UPI0039E73ED8
MMMFRLKPVAEALAHPAWAASRYCGSCLVLAENAERARCYASGAFTLPVWDREGSLPSHPWQTPDLVAAEELPCCGAEGLSETGPLVLEEVPEGSERSRAQV